ncbi:transcription factor iws-1 [Cladorrhinum sp. PSN259]|nr:transcription factor iws-1 [Cladorrhinum sp. PSN259]
MSESPIGSGAPPAEHHEDANPADTHDGGAGGGGDDESDILSDIDEDQFEDYEPELEDRQNVVIDENVTKGLKAAKRQQPTDDKATKKSKEGRRPKKRSRGDDDDEDVVEDGGRRPRKTRGTDSGRRAAAKQAAEPAEEPEENLTPEERRRRALSKAMDAALKNPTKRRRKKDEIDLEEEIDDQIANLKVAMERACIEDNAAREKGHAATNKLKLLPQVTALLNRTAVQNSILDPDTNFLQSVKYFLEPLNDGSLPAYNIQRDIFHALVRLPIAKDVLLSSGIGKVVFFYTKSKQPVPEIKRIAERLVGEWSRPVLKRTDDYKKRHIETRDFDIAAAKKAQATEATYGGSQLTLTQRPAGKSRFEIERERALAPEVKGNRAVMPGLPQSYTVAPKSTFNASQAGSEHRPIGSGGAEAFRKMITKGKGGRR